MSSSRSSAWISLSGLRCWLLAVFLLVLPLVAVHPEWALAGKDDEAAEPGVTNPKKRKVREVTKKVDQKVKEDRDRRVRATMVKVKAGFAKGLEVAQEAQQAQARVLDLLSKDPAAVASGASSSSTSTKPAEPANYPELEKEINGLLDQYEPDDAKALKQLVEARDFNTFFAQLNSRGGKYLGRDKQPGAGAIVRNGRAGANRDRDYFARRSYADVHGRVLQLERHISTILFRHIQEDSGSPGEIQTMYHNGDIYIAANSPEAIDAIHREAMARGGKLYKFLTETTGVEQSTSTAPTTVQDRDIHTRFNEKLSLLFAGERAGETTEFRLAAEMAGVLKFADAPKILHVDMATGDVTKWKERAAGESGRVFLVRSENNQGKRDTHAELVLMHVLDHVTEELGEEKVAYVAGQKRACMSCTAELVNALARDHKLVFSPHAGRLWSNQFDQLRDLRTKLTFVYLALAQPIFQTSSEEFDANGDLKKIGYDIEDKDDLSESEAIGGNDDDDSTSGDGKKKARK